MRMKLAVSMMRPAIFSRRRRNVANSVCQLRALLDEVLGLLTDAVDRFINMLDITVRQRCPVCACLLACLAPLQGYDESGILYYVKRPFCPNKR
jgi:hypothetical protein